MSNRRIWQECSQDTWAIHRIATKLLARLTYHDDANPIELERVRKIGAYALWLRQHYDALAKELD